MTFTTDPAYPGTDAVSDAWKVKSYILSSIPRRKPRSFVDDASEFLSSSVTNAFSFLSGGPVSPKAKPDDVFNGEIDLQEDSILEQERGEELEVDDAPDWTRKIRMLSLGPKDLEMASQKASKRRKFQIIPLRKAAKIRSGTLA